MKIEKTYGPFQRTYGTMYYVKDMAESALFYKKLGLTATVESPGWTEFSIGGHSLCLHAERPGRVQRENGVLIFAVDGVKAIYESMKRDGYDVFGLHEVHPAAWSFHLNDADKNETSFYGAP